MSNEAAHIRGRQVLVVGGLGFIGANLTRRLADAGDTVTALTPSPATHQDLAGEREQLV